MIFVAVSKEMVQRLVANWQAKCKDKGLDRDTMRGDLMNEFNMLDDFILDRSKCICLLMHTIFLKFFPIPNSM